VGGLKRLARAAEESAAGLALLAMCLLPVVEMALRALFGTGILGSSDYVQHLTLWVGFFGAMLAARDDSHLRLTPGLRALGARVERATRALAAVASVAVSCGLAWAGWKFIAGERESPKLVAGWIPVWIAEAIIPLTFAVLALRFVWRAGGWRARAVAALGVPLAWAFGFLFSHEPVAPDWTPIDPSFIWGGLGGLLLALLFGAPIFVALGGAALLLFFGDDTPVTALPIETYRLITSPSLPTIPLFTFAGFVLAEGGASERLLRLFRALFGWLPGGLAIVATFVCAFFTTFTGASGVTILALGGLLFPMLVQSGYRERFSVGLLTATGSIGLLFPPSLAVILYAVIAHVAIPDLFLGGVMPGFLLVAAVCLLGVREAFRARAPRTPFALGEALRALWQAKWDVLLPAVILVGIFGGFATLIEASAITGVYALLIEGVIHKTLHPLRDLPRVLLKCVLLIGGVFIILGVAVGLANWMVDAEIPMQAADWVESHVSSRLVFLLLLNAFLLVVGGLMDIFSAIVVVVPLIAPIAERYGIHPVHLGIIFLANLELGYLTPPVGMNLFLAAYRFRQPVVGVFRAVVPYLLVLIVVVLLITYLPWLSLALLN